MILNMYATVCKLLFPIYKAMQMTTKVYLDTWVVRGLVAKKRAEQNEVERMVRRLRYNVFEVVIPQIALGEAFAVIVRDYDETREADRALCKIRKELSFLPLSAKKGMPPLTLEIVQKAQELQEADTYLQDTDAIIAAQALLDPTSQRLLTHDKSLLRSSAIVNMEEKMRENGERSEELRVVDEI